MEDNTQAACWGIVLIMNAESQLIPLCGTLHFQILFSETERCETMTAWRYRERAGWRKHETQTAHSLFLCSLDFFLPVVYLSMPCPSFLRFFLLSPSPVSCMHSFCHVSCPPSLISPSFSLALFLCNHVEQLVPPAFDSVELQGLGFFSAHKHMHRVRGRPRSNTTWFTLLAWHR